MKNSGKHKKLKEKGLENTSLYHVQESFPTFLWFLGHDLSSAMAAFDQMLTMLSLLTYSLLIVGSVPLENALPCCV